MNTNILIPFDLHTQRCCDDCRKNIQEKLKRAHALIFKDGTEYISLNAFSTFMHKVLEDLHDMAIDSQTSEDYSFYASHTKKMAKDWMLFTEDILNMAADPNYEAMKNDLSQALDKVKSELKGLMDHFTSSHESLLQLGAPAPTIEILKNFIATHKDDNPDDLNFDQEDDCEHPAIELLIPANEFCEKLGFCKEHRSEKIDEFKKANALKAVNGVEFLSVTNYTRHVFNRLDLVMKELTESKSAAVFTEAEAVTKYYLHEWTAILTWLLNTAIIIESDKREHFNEGFKMTLGAFQFIFDKLVSVFKFTYDLAFTGKLPKDEEIEAM